MHHEFVTFGMSKMLSGLPSLQWAFTASSNVKTWNLTDKFVSLPLGPVWDLNCEPRRRGFSASADVRGGEHV